MQKNVEAVLYDGTFGTLRNRLAAAAAVSEQAAASAAQNAVGKPVDLIESDHDAEDSEWEFSFVGKKSYIRYDVLVNDQTGKVKEVEMEDETDEGSRSVSINVKKAKSAVKKECGKDDAGPASYDGGTRAD